jgi:hypothetical protein
MKQIFIGMIVMGIENAGYDRFLSALCNIEALGHRGGFSIEQHSRFIMKFHSAFLS